jgi:3-hydroxybutyrate dehydrogenase
MSLKGKAALVTGSTSGIGLAIARCLAEQGVKVMLNGFGDAAEIEKARAELAALAGDAAYHGADMTRPAEIAAMVAETEKRFGAVDILVNNAGIQHVANVEDFPVERWDSIIAINLSSAFHTVRAAMPGMKRRRWGRIVNVASTHGLVASAQKTAYVAAKHGIIGFTKAVALEAANTGVTCNAVCPGWVLTPLVQKQVDARATEKGVSVAEAKVALVSEKQPQTEFTTPEQIAGGVLFLCSDVAANMLGATLVMDGGWTAQ